MEKFRLISMVDLVLQGYNINQINNYANFLKQPIKLEMFVPCDDDGNAIKLPNACICTDLCRLCKKYQQAKEKVLFEGLNNKEIFYYLKIQSEYGKSKINAISI
jgi:hypothetical protein